MIPFLILSLLLFLLELALPPLLAIGWLIFPVFAVFYLLKSPDLARDSPGVLGAGLVFDAFSGLRFGWYSLLLGAVVVSVFLTQRWLAINRQSFWSVAFYTLLFLVEFTLLTAVALGGHYRLAQLPVILSEDILILIFLRWLYGLFSLSRAPQRDR